MSAQDVITNKKVSSIRFWIVAAIAENLLALYGLALTFTSVLRPDHDPMGRDLFFIGIAIGMMILVARNTVYIIEKMVELVRMN